jgi:hypothetical protein
MNERIRELLVQAMAEVGPDDTDTKTLERFAELIVQDCMAQCKDSESKDAIAIRFELQEHGGWVCPKCGIDRIKAACPDGHTAALTGHCPMVGTALQWSPPHTKA